MGIEKLKLAGLETYRITNGEKLPTIVLLHGYGASCDDLMPFHDILPSGKQYNWLFPNAPLPIEMMGQVFGFAWFPIDTIDLQRMYQAGDKSGIASALRSGITNARLKVEEFLGAAAIEARHTIIGGFSQGSVLAMDIALNSETSFHGVILTSAVLADAENWAQKLPDHLSMKTFQSHGRNDELLPFELANDLDQLLSSHNIKTEFHAFSGGHEIPPEVIRALETFICREKPDP